MTWDSNMVQESRCDRLNAIVSVRSARRVDDTVHRITSSLAAKGVKLFAIIDHAGEARAAGLTMRPTVVVIFGSPKAGTPLMLASPSIALDLPLKILVSEDADGVVWMSFVAPACLAQRHELPPDLLRTLEAVEAIVAAAA